MLLTLEISGADRAALEYTFQKLSAIMAGLPVSEEEKNVSFEKFCHTLLMDANKNLSQKF